ncbi:MAG: hypothetical protein RBU25_00385 [Lentisphaeria bacterium]|jgi:hypothetical protein|nr:hypothetical protein [Lentisphaeria bacterium]
MRRLFPLFAAAGLAAQEPAVWRSEFYPENWTPQHTLPDGRFLHDFSYAGYRGGEEPPVVAGPEFVLQGADATGAADATATIQALLDEAGAKGGGVVRIPAGLYRCDGVLTMRHPHLVLRGDGPDQTRLFFTSMPGGGKNHLNLAGGFRLGDEIPLARDGANRADYVEVADPGALAVGQEVAVGWTITPEFIEEHGMTGTWKAFNGTWRPIFLRTVAAIDAENQPARVYLDVPLRYPAQVRDRASIKLASGYLAESGIENLGVSNAIDGKTAWEKPGIHAIGLRGVKDCWVRNVHSFPSPLAEAKDYHLQNGGILIVQSRRVTVADCDMRKAQNRGGGGAGYLFHVSRSNEILTRDCVGIAGRHNFIQNWDFGSTGLVWLRCHSAEGRGYNSRLDPVGYMGLSEYHHSLAMACLVDACTLDDGWFGGNRHDWSSGAGGTVTQSVYWNTAGRGVLRSWQSGHGYIIGTTDIRVETSLDQRYGQHTAPEDTREGIGQGAGLRPVSLYEDQRARRLQSWPK